MKTFIDMKTVGDILTKDITAHKPKMERPVVEIIPLDVVDIVVESPGYEMKETDDLG